MAGAMLPNGTTIAMATQYAMEINITAITNANPAEATSEDHGLMDGDIIVISSGWGRLNNRVVRVANADTDTFELEGIDTTATAIYPIGAGIGTAKKVMAWAQIQQVTASVLNGGELQTTTYQFLEDQDERQLATVYSAQGLEVTIAYDPALPGFAALEAASDERAVRVIRCTLPNKDILLYNAQVSFQSSPTMDINEVMTNTANFLLQSKYMRYGA